MTRTWFRVRFTVLAGLVLVACGPQAPVADTGTTHASTSTTPGTSEDGPTSAGPSTSVAPSTTTDALDGGSSSSTESSTGTDTGPACAMPTCSGNVYACTDGIDNDRDGLVDFDDPFCLQPCDDSEDDFQLGLPGGGIDCKMDCYFDGDDGMGNDQCISDLKCDPADPGAPISCDYVMSMACAGLGFPVVQQPECLAFCEPRVPPGCDCFGCCEVQAPGGPLHIMLFSAQDDCTLDTPENCAPCTSQIEQCGNPCEGCEICFGQTEPPAGCERHTCDTGPTCVDHCDCPEGGYCYAGCCFPAPPP